MADRTDSGNDVGALIGTGDKSLFERVGLWLAAGDWHYTEGSEGNWYSMQVSLECGSVRTIIDTETRENEEIVMIYSIFRCACRRPAGRRWPSSSRGSTIAPSSLPFRSIWPMARRRCSRR